MDKHHKFDTDKLLQMEDESFAMTICALFIICHEDDNDYKSDRLKAKKILRYLLSNFIISDNANE